MADIEDNVLLSHAETHELGLVLATDKLERKIPSGTKMVISKADRFDEYTVNNIVEGTSTCPPINRQPQ